MNRDTIWIVTAAPSTSRGQPRVTEISLDELSLNINIFIEQMRTILERTPEKIGKFDLAEIEIHTEISAKGTLVILGTGGEIGANGGLKFVFRRLPAGQGQ
jgi:hypothetical protein